MINSSKSVIKTITLETKEGFSKLNEIVNTYLEVQRISENSLISIETSVYQPSFAEIDTFYSTIVYKTLKIVK